jgi:hypothetical protein
MTDRVPRRAAGVESRSDVLVAPPEPGTNPDGVAKRGGMRRVAVVTGGIGLASANLDRSGRTSPPRSGSTGEAAVQEVLRC